ncbi:glycosyltransferase family 61 protein [Citrobacter amalonaticus]|uniref:glycosyltransferase family 61 protein n=1 Tax=Citrobacter amalonaticus TaxID=35703 RepID=UPI001BB652AD|nr:glycosyltransferase 61 family protein [Citrobacter amalonaticus]UBI22486.1 glycosyltransferase family 61 protein [Citrobacter amalonaticus]BCU49227.1 hypothetical protein CIAM_27480 [Citrobacter amalonaticus]
MKLARHSLPVLTEYKSLDVKCLNDYIIDLDFFAYNDELKIYEDATVNEYIHNNGWIKYRAKNHPDLGFKYSEVSIDHDGGIIYPEKKYERINNNCELFIYDYSWGHNYQHWLISSLGRLFIYCELKKKKPELKLLVSDDRLAYKMEVIKLLGIDCADLVYHKNIIKYKKVYVCNFNSGSGISVNALSINYYEMLSKLVHDNNQSPKKIYITRDDSQGKRPLKNRKEINAILTENGFEVIKLEQLNFKEKISIFKNADVIVGDFSAGWGHIVFCKENTRLILLEHDIFRFRHFYEEIANQKNMQFIAITSVGFFRSIKLKIYKAIWLMTKTVDRSANSLPWSVNINKLKELL